jgi:hypothetical protein
MPLKLGAFDGFMTSKKYAKARRMPPSIFYCQNNYNHNFNKQKQEGEEPPSTTPFGNKKKLESFYKAQKVVCASHFCWISIKWHLCG